jgi:putative ABC transport system ATP-binding protein
LLRDVHERLGATVLMVTHDRQVAASCPRVVALRDGRVESDSAASGSAQ